MDVSAASDASGTMDVSGALLAFCNPLLDITASIDAALLDRYALQANNAILAEEKHLALYDELVRERAVLYTAGGAAQNSMRAAQWLLPPRATVFAGCVGADASAQQLAAAAATDGLQTEYAVDAAMPTGRCACLITNDGHSRSLVAHLGAANSYRLEHVREARMAAILDRAACIYVSGFFLTVSPPTAMHVARTAHAQGKIFCLNISAPFVPEHFFGPLADLLPYVDYLFGNESEALALAAALHLAPSSVSAIAAHLAAMPKVDGTRGRCVVVTQGAVPTVVAVDGRVDLFPVEPLAAGEIIDTNGAGDAFVGGFLSQLVLGRPLASSVAAAHYTAAAIIRRSGITFPERPATTLF